MMFRMFALSLLCLAVISSCSSLKPKERKSPIDGSSDIYIPDTAGKVAKVVFDSSWYDFGTVMEGDPLKREIWFTNVGPGDLLIELMTACECTTLDYTRLPVRKGQRSKISISYNSVGKEGKQTVDLDMIANTDPIVTTAKFKLFVVKKDQNK
ncbi:MAG TPA: DUF1573 domain-containing protein [Saprospiraceae bacterium]|nr:DUF1573 domain-containing protein [Saprospiraceae bacterium]